MASTVGGCVTIDRETKNFLYKIISVMETISEDTVSDEDRGYHRSLLRELEEELLNIVGES
jgi:hypothetical protein